MKLVREINEDIELIVEGEEGAPKSYFIQGPFLQSEVVNINKRRYPSKILDEEIARYNDSHIKNNRAYGELGHPNTPKINLDRVSHMIVSLKKEGNDYIGKAKLIDTPMGKIAISLVKEGARLGVSSRGVGSVEEENGVNVIQSDFRLSTAADIVADPSGPDCFVSGLMEDRDWVWNNGSWEEKQLTQAKNELKREFSVNKQVKIFEEFIQKLNRYK